MAVVERISELWLPPFQVGGGDVMLGGVEDFSQGLANLLPSLGADSKVLTDVEFPNFQVSSLLHWKEKRGLIVFRNTDAPSALFFFLSTQRRRWAALLWTRLWATPTTLTSDTKFAKKSQYGFGCQLTRRRKRRGVANRLWQREQIGVGKSASCNLWKPR